MTEIRVRCDSCGQKFRTDYVKTDGNNLCPRCERRKQKRKG